MATMDMAGVPYAASMPITMERLRRFMPGLGRIKKTEGTEQPTDRLQEEADAISQRAGLIKRSITAVVHETQRTEEQKAADLADQLLLEFALEEKLSVAEVKQHIEEQEVGNKPDNQKSMGKRIASALIRRLIKFLVKRVIKTAVKGIFRLLIRTLWRYVLRAAVNFVVRFVIRYLVMGIVSAIGTVISAIGLPVVLGGLAIGGAGFLLYKKFFPDTPDEKAKDPTPAQKQPGPFWKRIIGRFFGIVDDTFGALENVSDTVSNVITSGPVNRTPIVISPEMARKNGIARLKNRSQDVADVIHEAAELVGEDEATMTAFVAIESNFDPNAGAGTTSAKGLFQFTGDTWTAMKKKYGAKFGIPLDASVWDKRSNAIMGAVFLKYEVRPAISRVVNNPNAADLYFGHFLGSGGGPRFLRGFYSNPNATVDGYVSSDALAANHPVFYNKDGSFKTLAEVYMRYANILTPIESYVRSAQNTGASVVAATPVGQVDPKTAAVDQAQATQATTQAQAANKDENKNASDLARNPPPTDYARTSNGYAVAIN